MNKHDPYLCGHSEISKRKATAKACDKILYSQSIGQDFKDFFFSKTFTYTRLEATQHLKLMHWKYTWNI